MQAAEAYAAKTRASRSTSSGNSSGTACANGGTWSSGSKTSWSSTPTNSSTNRGRSRPQLTNDTFRPPSRGYGNSRPASRTTSASPGPWRRQRQASGDSSLNEPQQPLMQPSSTHSTPCKKPFGSSAHGENKMSTSVGNAKSHKTLADLDLEEEDAILKRMEEILLTYKSRVETHLAAEGRELPKEIFEDFTSQWVAASTANSRPMASTRSPSTSALPRATPSPRKAKQRDSSKTRIPVPTFYS